MPARTGESASGLQVAALMQPLKRAGGVVGPCRFWPLSTHSRLVAGRKPLRRGGHTSGSRRKREEQRHAARNGGSRWQGLDKAGDVDPERDPELLEAGAIEENLRLLGDPPSKMYPGQLPLFSHHLPDAFWCSIASARTPPSSPGIPSCPAIHLSIKRCSTISTRIHVTVEYQVHAYNRRQHDEQVAARRFRWIASMATGGVLLAVIWIYLVQRQERERQNAESGAKMLEEAKQRGLEEELRRREAEQKQEQTQRQLLEQQLAREEAERQAWELKSSLFANIGIMAGSYAHNIKNLLVRPNDLLHRCLESDGMSGDQSRMIEEVRHTLGTVTQRLQEILRTVNRDHSKSEPVRLDLNKLTGELGHTWQELARERWKLQLEVSLANEPLWIEMDASQLQQALENLLFNARDAVAEMRGLRQARARQDSGISSTERKAGLIAAAGWVGKVSFRTYRQDRWAVLEVQDDGAGMADEVRARCTESRTSPPNGIMPCSRATPRAWDLGSLSLPPFSRFTAPTWR